MTDPNKAEDRDEVLFSFHEECERPTAEQIVAWVSRYPQFAEDIRAHAAVAWDWAMREGRPTEELDASLSARAHSQALNIIFSEENSAAANRHTPACTTFQQMLGSAGKEVHQLARELDIDRSVLADLFNGWMFQPVCERLVGAVISSLSISLEAFVSAIQIAVENPRLGHAKADKIPIVKPRSCEEIIRDSNMSAERKRYWLEKD
jgi:hypothetical protein